MQPYLASDTCLICTMSGDAGQKGRQAVQAQGAQPSLDSQLLVHVAFEEQAFIVPAVLRILLSSERGLVACFKNGQCIDEGEVESAITRRYLEHVMRLSLAQDGLGSRVGLFLGM